MPTERHQTYLIVGGGIGGLTTGLALARKGIASKIFEQRGPDEADGAGIQIGPNGVSLLRALGADHHLKSRACEPKHIRVRSAASNAVLSDLPLGAWISARHNAPYWTLRRRDLHIALLQLAATDPKIELYHNTPVQSVAEHDDRVTLTLADGTTEIGAGAIHADGLWSDTAVGDGTGNSPPTPIGKSAFRALVKSEDLPLGQHDNETNIWLHPGAHVVSYPVYAGHQRALVLILDDQDQRPTWNREVPSADITPHTSAFADELKSVLVTVDIWRAWPLFSRNVDTRWSTPRTTKVGDAAAPVLPFLAQGGVMAIEDGVVLANCIAGAPDINEAFTAYEHLRRPRHAHVAEASQQNGRIYHMGGLQAVARNASLRLVPTEQMMMRYDWLYGWRLPTGMSV